MIEKKVVKLSKLSDGSMVRNPITEHGDSINVCASIGEFDLTRYGVAKSIANTMDKAVQVAVAAGLEALRDAGIVNGSGSGTSGWVLPEAMQQTTGVVYATSFPALDTAISEVSNFFKFKLAQQISIPTIIDALRFKLISRLEHTYSENSNSDQLPEPVESALNELTQFLGTIATDESAQYEFDRKFLFRVLVLGNSQLAQIVKARGPNVQTNAACAGIAVSILLKTSCNINVLRRLNPGCCICI